MLERRLQTLEKATAHLPRTGAELLRLSRQRPEVAHEAWLTTLTDDELAALEQAASEERWAAGLPVYDYSGLTDDELDQLTGAEDDPLLAKCPILQPPQEVTV